MNHVNQVIVPEEWPRKKKIRVISILLFVVAITLIISI